MQCVLQNIKKTFFILSEAFSERSKHKIFVKAENASLPQMFFACL